LAYILLTRGKHWHDRIIWLIGKFWVHSTSLTPPHVIDVPVSSQETGKWAVMYLCVRCIDFAFSYDFVMNFGSVRTVWHFPFILSFLKIGSYTCSMVSFRQNLPHQELRMLQLSKIWYGSSYKEIYSDKYLELKFL